MKKDKKKLLITGVSGLLGNNLAYYFRDKYSVLGLYGRHPVSIPGIRTGQADILSLSRLAKQLATFRPDIVIHCASLTSIDECERNPSATREVNVIGTRNVVQMLKPKVKLVYISTDSVYDGSKGNFRESDPVAPQNYYGVSKFEGELEVLKRKNSLVLRTNIFGWNILDKFSIAEWILHQLTNKRKIKGFKDAYFSSIYTFELARLLEAGLKKCLGGIYNCASQDSCSKYEFALRLAQRFGLAASLIKPISIDDFGFAADRGKNLSLNTKALSRALKIRLPSIRDSIEHFYRDYQAALSVAIKQGDKTKKASSGVKTIPYGRHSIDEQDIAAVTAVLRSDWVTQGPKIKEFEDTLCKYTGAKYAVCVSSGTAALHIACLAAGIKKGDEVITSPITFAASANCVLYCGGKPVFADVEPASANISPDEIVKKITPKTKAIIPVDYAGNSCAWEAIRSIAKKHRLLVIEDAAHALGAEYKGRRIGSCAYSDMTVLSFHPVKTITTAEGGAVLTNDPRLYERLLVLRNHGITKQGFVNKAAGEWYYEMQHLGFNYRMTDIQAALGLSQLDKIDAFISRRRQIASIYDHAFAHNQFFNLPVRERDCQSSCHLYTIRLKDALVERKAEIFKRLRSAGLGVQVHYIPVYLHPYYRKQGYAQRLCPRAEDFYAREMSLPLYPLMKVGDVRFVIDTLREVLKEFK